MEKLYATRAQIRAIGRSALVGTLAGLLSMQVFASGLSDALKSSDQHGSASASIGFAPESSPAVNSTPSTSSNAIELSALPPAPEVARAKAPASLDPMVADAAGDGQALTSAPKTSDKKLQRPGMLVMAIAGLPLIALGAYLYSYPTNNTSAKEKWGTIFMAPGAAMSGLGFYFAFHKKN